MSRPHLWICAVVLASASLEAEARPPRGRARTVGHQRVRQSLSGWRTSGFRAGGSAVVSFTEPDGDARWGSLELRLPGPVGSPDHEAWVERWADDVEIEPAGGLFVGDAGYGHLRELEGARFSWRRGSESTAAPHLGVAFCLVVHDPDLDQTWALIWEPVYNGYPVSTGVPADTWVRSDVARGVVWRRPVYIEGRRAAGFCGAQPRECHRYDRGPLDWGFGPRTVILGIQLAAGSGWSGHFVGYVDDIELELGGRTHRWNFEPTPRAIRAD